MVENDFKFAANFRGEGRLSEGETVGTRGDCRDCQRGRLSEGETVSTRGDFRKGKRAVT